MIATEDARNEVLTIHLPASEFPKLEANQDKDLDLYTKVSVSKRVKTLDISPSMFAELVSASEKQIVALLGPNSDIFKRVEGNTGKGLTEYRDQHRRRRGEFDRIDCRFYGEFGESNSGRSSDRRLGQRRFYAVVERRESELEKGRHSTSH